MDFIRSIGEIDITIEDDVEGIKVYHIKNKTLRPGRIAIVEAISNNFGAAYEYFVTSMAFGSGGTVGGTTRYIDDTRTGLFGPTLATKSVIASINPDVPTQVTFTSVLTRDELNGEIINEIGLKMKSGDFLSMATFGDVTKTSQMQITYNWKISYI